MRFVSLVAGFATACLLLATHAGAAAITFQMSVPNASGVNNGVSFTNQTVSIMVQADTAQVVAAPGMIGGPGNCVPAISTSISVGGGPAIRAIAPMFFCATHTALVTGVFTTATGSANFYFIADYSNAGITTFALASNFPLTANVPGDTASTNSPLNLAGGGTAAISVVPPTGTTFSAALGAVAAPVPTLDEIGLLALAALLALAGIMAFRQRIA